MLTGHTLLLLLHSRGRTDSPVQCEILSICETSKYWRIKPNFGI